MAWAWAWAWVLGLGLFGCSLLYDLSPDQCGANAHCAERFGQGFVCDDGLCRYDGPADAPTDPTDGEADAGLGDPDAECQSHGECIAKHGDVNPRACVDGACRPLRSDECPLLLPLKNDGWLDNLVAGDAVILGGYSPIPNPTRISHFTRFYDLALAELTAEVHGLPGPGGTRRRLVMVVCEGGSPERGSLLASAKHLMQQLHVPGIVSTLQSADLQYVFEEVGREQGTFFVSALDADDAILGLDDEGLVWTVLTGADQVAATVAPLLTRSLDYLQRESNLAEADVRVALVSPTGEPRLLGDMAEAIIDSIEFNGRSANQNFPDHFRAIDIETIYGTGGGQDQSGVIAQLLDFVPHVIIAMAADEFLHGVIPDLESRWVDTGQAPPFYIMSPYHLDNASTGVVLDAVPGIQGRMLGVAYASAEDPSVYRDYLIRLDQAYPEVRNDPSRLRLENFYDAPYYLLYAAAAAGNPPVLTGNALARGMTRLLSGPTYDIGRADMVEAFGLLQANPRNSITLRGTLGPANFDPTTGARADSGSVYCIDGSGNPVPDAWRWNEADEEFVESETPIDPTCIEGF